MPAIEKVLRGKPVPGWYYRLSQYFREQFGEKVYKVPLDANLTCPNRDGTLSKMGCIYCYNPGFSPQARRREQEGRGTTILDQVRIRQLKMEKAEAAGFQPKKKYLAYFQSYSNTYGDISYLQRLYEEALEAPGVIGLSVATRPDCLSPKILDLLAGYAENYHIWLELGLQSSHDETLTRINRGHGYACFEEAVLRCLGRGLHLCAHLINGLPGEGTQEMLTTIKRLNGLPLQGVKFHQLQVIKGTPLYSLYEQGTIRVFGVEEYLDILCRQLETLRSDIVVHRLLSDVTDLDLLVAPTWRIYSTNFASKVQKELQNRHSYQGKHVAYSKPEN